MAKTGADQGQPSIKVILKRRVLEKKRIRIIARLRAADSAAGSARVDTFASPGRDPRPDQES